MKVLDLKFKFRDIDNTTETGLDDFEVIVDSEEGFQTIGSLTYNEKKKEVTVHLVPLIKKGER